MTFVNYTINAPRDLVMKNLSANEEIVSLEKIDTSKGIPRLLIKDKGEKVKIKCEMLGRATKDNAFLEGTEFHGKIKEVDGKTYVNGVILTAPIYHSALILLFSFFIYRCITLGGISFTPIILLAFSLMMFMGEFKKQSIIKRFILRALKMTYRDMQGSK